MEYVPFAIKDNPQAVEERIWYSFDGTTSVFDFADVQPKNAGAIVVFKKTKFAVG
ncbi:MAG TPA: hypothetical protein VNI77_04030 [Nitrososphaera sp.]|nr:hypothetical protein [Nitrososphaera sp.]